MLRLVISFVIAFTLMWGLLGTQKALSHERPSAMMCWFARGAVAEAGGEAAAEKAARARGVSEGDIAKAKRCRR
jgi:hypothetical protein